MSIDVEAAAETGPQRNEREHAPRGLIRVGRRTWAQLTSMRTALVLLFLLALASVPGSLFPQRGVNPVQVNLYLSAHPKLGPLLDKAYAFDVFAAPWFAAVYLLLVVSLVGCVFPRLRRHLRDATKPPPRLPARLAALPNHRALPDPVDVPLDAAEAWLRNRRWRIRRTPDGISAQKGYLKETGNLLFHAGLLALLAGIALGGLFGYKATALVQEGGSFQNSRVAFDDYLPGRLTRDSAIHPFALDLRSFRARYLAGGQASSFDAFVTVRQPDRAPFAYDLRVNHPLKVGGVKAYLIGHGYAPEITVRDATGNTVFQGGVPCLPQDPRLLSQCTVKVPDAQPEQLGFDGDFSPTTQITPRGLVSAHPAPLSPSLTLAAWVGDLGLDSGVPQSVYSLDKTNLRPAADPRSKRQLVRTLRVGESLTIPGRGSLTFDGFHQWITVQTTSDPGKGLALVAALVMICGLMLSLGVRRRRVFVAINDDGQLALAGLARERPEALHAELEELTTALTRPPATTRTSA